MHPGIAEQYAARVAALHDNIARHASLDVEASVALVNEVRDLVKRVTVTPTGKGRDAPVAIALEGKLALFLERPEQERSQGLYKVVAGGGIEPPTCGL